MIHQHHKKSSSSSYKEQSNRSTTRRRKSNQQMLIKIISLHIKHSSKPISSSICPWFPGFAGDNQFSLAPKYCGTKYNIDRNLTNEGYNVHEANIGAFSSNYDRAVELYYYVKGGRVDYGAAHAAKYGHHRYGRTYKGIMRDWEPGKNSFYRSQYGWSNHSSNGRILKKW